MVIANLWHFNSSSLRGQREISVVCFQRTSAALVYNLQASLHCTRWHGRSAPPKNHQLRLALRKRPMRRVLWYFLSAQKVRIKKNAFLFAIKLKGKIYSKYTYFLVFSVLFTLAVCCYYHSRCFCCVLLAAKRTKSPGTRNVAVGCCFVRKLPLATFLSHFQPCHESLFVCFLGAAELSRLASLCVSNQRSYSPRTISKKQTAFRCATYGAGFVYKLLLLIIKVKCKTY